MHDLYLLARTRIEDAMRAREKRIQRTLVLFWFSIFVLFAENVLRIGRIS